MGGDGFCLHPLYPDPLMPSPAPSQNLSSDLDAVLAQQSTRLVQR